MGRKGFVEFRYCRTSTDDAEGCEYQNKVASNGTILKSHNVLSTDRKLKVREITEAIGTSLESVVRILNDHLDLRKVYTR